MDHPIDWIAHFIIGLVVTWLCKEINLDNKTSALMGMNTIITIEGTQIESGISQGEDHLIDIFFGSMGVLLATETEPFRMSFEKGEDEQWKSDCGD